MSKCFYTDDEINNINKGYLSSCDHLYELKPVMDPFDNYKTPTIFANLSNFPYLYYGLDCVKCKHRTYILITEYNKLMEKE